MAASMAAGKRKSREHMVEGLATFPETLLTPFKGENSGKRMLKVCWAELRGLSMLTTRGNSDAICRQRRDEDLLG
jgi:hypothetical protein